MIVPKNRLVHALDVAKASLAIPIAEEVADYVDYLKISWPVFSRILLEENINIVKKLREDIGLPVLACFKIADTPHMSRRIMEMAIDAGAEGVTVHGFVGPDSVRECIESAKERDVSTFIVTEMSHPGAEVFMQPLSEGIAEMARDLGADGIIAPATRPARVRKLRDIVGPGMLILSPGVGPQGGEVGDAILSGADMEIVGRLIYMSETPGQTAKRISETLMSRVNEREHKDSQVTQLVSV